MPTLHIIIDQASNAAGTAHKFMQNMVSSRLVLSHYSFVSDNAETQPTIYVDLGFAQRKAYTDQNNGPRLALPLSPGAQYTHNTINAELGTRNVVFERTFVPAVYTSRDGSTLFAGAGAPSAWELHLYFEYDVNVTY